MPGPPHPGRGGTIGNDTNFGAEPQGEADDVVGMHWWNALTEAERAYWLKRANSAKPSDAWETFKREGGH